MLIAGGKIPALGKKDAVKIPPDARQVDVTGKTLMPALIDLHTHLLPSRVADFNVEV
jgi:imidazolonepropionase-like amidohydrolase